MLLTAGIFAYNEEKNLRATVETLLDAAKQLEFDSLEVIIVNDGSTDGTESILTELKQEHPNIQTISYPRNKGIGTAISDIIAAASGDKICFLAGDNIFTPYTVQQVLKQVNKAEVILHYHVNGEVRKKGRMLLSLLFTFAYKFIYNLQLIYINCLGTYPLKELRKINISSKRYNIAAEINVKMLLTGHTYYEMASYMNPAAQKSSALSMKNFFDIIISFIKLWYEIKISNRSLYNKKPTRIIDSL